MGRVTSAGTLIRREGAGAVTGPAVLCALGVVATIGMGCAPEVGPGAEGGADAGEPASEGAAPASPVRRMPAPPVTGSPVAEPGGSTEITYTMVTVRSGAELEVELIDPIRPGELRPGDRLRFGVTRPVIENQMVMVPLNSLINGEVTSVATAAGGEGGVGAGVMVTVRFVDVFFNGEAWPITASVVEVLRAPGGDAAGGQAVGSNLGRVLAGGREGTVAGAAAGEAGGSAMLLPAEETDSALPVGTILRLRLDEPFVFGLPNI